MIGCSKRSREFDPEHRKLVQLIRTRPSSVSCRRYFRDSTWAVRVPRQLQERVWRERRRRDADANDSGVHPARMRSPKRPHDRRKRLLEALEADGAYGTTQLEPPSDPDIDRHVGAGSRMRPRIAPSRSSSAACWRTTARRKLLRPGAGDRRDAIRRRAHASRRLPTAIGVTPDAGLTPAHRVRLRRMRAHAEGADRVVSEPGVPARSASSARRCATNHSDRPGEVEATVAA